MFAYGVNSPLPFRSPGPMVPGRPSDMKAPAERSVPPGQAALRT